MSVVQSSEVVHFSGFQYTRKFDDCQFYGGCPLLGGLVNYHVCLLFGDSTVLHTCNNSSNSKYNHSL